MTVYAEHDANLDSIEAFDWDELLWLTEALVRHPVPNESYMLAAKLVDEARLRMRGEPSSVRAWVETEPSEFDPLTPSGPLRETELGGLDTREIVEPDVFRHFFGAAAR
jgi:hypothetical protein